MAKRSYRALILAHYDPDNNPWDPPLRSYFPAPSQRPVTRPGGVRGTPTVDGGMRQLVWGGGRAQRVPLPIYKRKRPRRS